MQKANDKIILIAEDDEEDRLLIRDAINEYGIFDLKFVENGEELIDYLKGTAKYSDRQIYTYPDLIILDLNMPRKDGREALKEIKEDKSIKKVPMIILTTSNREEDILTTYNLGVTSYITKPVTFSALVDIFSTVLKYWLDIVVLPISK